MSVLLYHDLGCVNLSMGNFEPALKAFRRISEIDPGNPYAAHGACMATILSGKLVEADYLPVAYGRAGQGHGHRESLADKGAR